MPKNSIHAALTASIAAAITEGFAERNGEGPVTVNVTMDAGGKVKTEIVKPKGTTGDR
jgi:hypothetical protein